MNKGLRMFFGIIFVVSIVWQAFATLGYWIECSLWMKTIEFHNIHTAEELREVLAYKGMFWTITLGWFYWWLILFTIPTTFLLVYTLLKYKRRPENNMLYAVLFVLLTVVCWYVFQSAGFLTFSGDVLIQHVVIASEDIGHYAVLSRVGDTLTGIRLSLIVLQLFLIGVWFSSKEISTKIQKNG